METPGCLIIPAPSRPAWSGCNHDWLTDMCSARLHGFGGRGATWFQLEHLTHISSPLLALVRYLRLFYKLAREVLFKDKWFSCQWMDTNLRQMPDLSVMSSCMQFHAVSPGHLTVHCRPACVMWIWVCARDHGRSRRPSRVHETVHETVLHSYHLLWCLQHIFCLRYPWPVTIWLLHGLKT